MFLLAETGLFDGKESKAAKTTARGASPGVLETLGVTITAAGTSSDFETVVSAAIDAGGEQSARQRDPKVIRIDERSVAGRGGALGQVQPVKSRHEA